jgi:hypothetical protein
VRLFPKLRAGLIIVDEVSAGERNEITFSRLTRPPLVRRVLGTAREMTVMTSVTSARWLGLVLLAGVVLGRPTRAAELNDYPTAARADYIFACMKTNGETRRALEQCSCSIDVIASILPYDRYVAAETYLSLAQVPGRFGAMFQSPEQARAATNDLRRAQAEAGVRCF